MSESRLVLRRVAKDALKVTFAPTLKLEFHGTKVTRDATFKANNLNFG